MSTQLLREVKINRIIDHHFKEGFIIISASRHEKSKEQNEKDYKELKGKVMDAGFSFIPVFGGTKEKIRNEKGEETAEEKEVFESSLIVPNQMLAASKFYKTDDKLFELGKQLAKDYDQDSFFYKPKGETKDGYYIDKNGKELIKFTDVIVNDVVQHFFTKLRGSKEKADRRFVSIKEQKPDNEEIFIKTYISKAPTSNSNACTRYGEIFYR